MRNFILFLAILILAIVVIAINVALIGASGEPDFIQAYTNLKIFIDVGDSEGRKEASPVVANYSTDGGKTWIKCLISIDSEVMGKELDSNRMDLVSEKEAGMVLHVGSGYMRYSEDRGSYSFRFDGGVVKAFIYITKEAAKELMEGDDKLPIRDR